MSKVMKMFSPKAKNSVLDKNPVIAMPDALEVKKKKMKELSRVRSAMTGGLNTRLSEIK